MTHWDLRCGWVFWKLLMDCPWDEHPQWIEGNRKRQRRNEVLSKTPHKFWTWISSTGDAPVPSGPGHRLSPKKEVMILWGLLFSTSVHFLGEAWAQPCQSLGHEFLHLTMLSWHFIIGWFRVNPWGKLNLGSDLKSEWNFLPCEGSE